MAFDTYKARRTAAEKRAARRNGGRPAIDASKACSKCLQQLLIRRDLANPGATSIHMHSAQLLEIGYQFCSTCADLFKCSSPDQINPRPSDDK